MWFTVRGWLSAGGLFFLKCRYFNIIFPGPPMSVRSNLLVHVRQTKSNQKTQDTHAYHYRRRHLETKFIGIGTSLANADFSTSIPLLCWNNYSAWLFTCSLPFSSCDLSFDVLSVLHACISMILIILSMISIELGKLWAIFYVVRSWHEFLWNETMILIYFAGGQ